MVGGNLAPMGEKDDLPGPRRRRPPICPKCLGAGKAFTFALISGRTREVWLKCSACSGSIQSPIAGP